MRDGGTDAGQQEQTGGEAETESGWLIPRICRSHQRVGIAIFRMQGAEGCAMYGQ